MYVGPTLYNLTYSMVTRCPGFQVTDLTQVPIPCQSQKTIVCDVLHSRNLSHFWDHNVDGGGYAYGPLAREWDLNQD